MDITTFLIIIIGVVLFLLILSEIEVYSGYNYHQLLNPELYAVPFVKDSENMKNIKYAKDVKNGEKIAQQSSVVICCLARNVTKSIKDNMKRLEYIGLRFNKYKIVLFENDSKDDSRTQLKNWTESNPNVILLDCCDMGSCTCVLKKKEGYDLGQLTEKRIRNMTLYRNKYLDYVKKNLVDYDYMIVVDFDLKGSINIDGLYNTLSYDDWDAVFVNGRTSIFGTFGLITIPYDSVAYVSQNSEYQEEHSLLKNILNYYPMIMDQSEETSGMIPVKSAFNGYGIYKIKSIGNCSYDGGKVCEHINLAKCMYENNKKIYVNPNWKGYFDLQGPGSPLTIFWNYLTK